MTQEDENLVTIDVHAEVVDSLEAIENLVDSVDFDGFSILLHLFVFTFDWFDFWIFFFNYCILF